MVKSWNYGLGLQFRVTIARIYSIHVDMLNLLVWNVDADVEREFFSPGKWSQDYPMKIIWRRGFLRLVLVGGILWMLLILSVLVFHVWSCQSSIAFFSGIFGDKILFS